VDAIRDHALAHHPHLGASQAFGHPLACTKGLGEGVEGIIAPLAVVAEEMGLLDEASGSGLSECGDEGVGLLARSQGRDSLLPYREARSMAPNSSSLSVQESVVALSVA
jgi:hypothetical protein